MSELIVIKWSEGGFLSGFYWKEDHWQEVLNGKEVPAGTLALQMPPPKTLGVENA